MVRQTGEVDGFAAVVLAGGRARRLSGVDKAGLRVAGRTLLGHVLVATADAEPVVVVGPERPAAGVVWTREDPPGGGPVAALAAGLAALPPNTGLAPDTALPPNTGLAALPDDAAAGGGAAAGLVAVLAVDQPGVTARTVRRLRTALADRPDAAGALLVDDTGRRQWLAGVWRVAALRAALPADPAGGSLRAVLGGLPVVEVAALPGEADDVDTPEDLRRWGSWPAH